MWFYDRVIIFNLIYFEHLLAYIWLIGEFSGLHLLERPIGEYYSYISIALVSCN